MTITKRRIISALATAGIALSAATGVLAPVAQAQPNNGGGSTHEQKCEEYWSWFEDDVNFADKMDKAGNTAARDGALADAAEDLFLARYEGCDWAAFARVPTRVAVPAPITATFAR